MPALRRQIQIVQYVTRASRDVWICEQAMTTDTRTEWGVRYEVPDPDPLHQPTRTQVVANEELARAAVRNGAPIRALHRRVVRREVTEWEDA